MSVRRVSIESAAGSIPATLTESSSEILVLSHGIFVDRTENGRFERLAEQLRSASLSSVAFDLPGHGESPIASVDAGLSNMVASLIDTVHWAKRNFDRVGLVASSFSGALTALAWPEIADEITGKFAFLNPVLRFDDTFIDPRRPEMLEMFNPATFAEAMRTGFFEPIPTFSMSRDMLLDFRSASVPNAYQKIDRDHTIFHGDADELIPYDSTLEIAARNESCRWIRVRGGVHAFTRSGHEAEVWSKLIQMG